MLIGIIIGLAVGFVLGFVLASALSVVLFEDEYRPTAPVMYGYGGSDAGAAWRMQTTGETVTRSTGGSVPARPGDVDPYWPQREPLQVRDPVERFRLAMIEELETDENGDWIDDEQLRIWERRATK